MGKYFDYTPVKPWAGGLGDFADSIGEGLDSYYQGQQDKKKLAIAKQGADNYGRQVDATNAAAEQKKYHDDITFQQQQADRDARTAKEATDAAASNQTAKARAIAATGGYIDPRTGKRVGGVSFTPDELGPAPQAPVAPERPETLPVTKGDPVAIAQMFGAMGGADPEALTQNPEQARTKAMAKMLGTQPAAPGSGAELLAKAGGEEAYGSAERAQRIRGQSDDNRLQNDINQSTYGREKAGYDVENAGYQAVREKYDRDQAHPQFTIGVNGQQIHYNPEEAKVAKAEEAKKTAADLRSQASAIAATDPTLANRMLVTAATIEANIPAAAASAINNAAGQGQAESLKQKMQTEALRSQERQGAGHDRARVAAAAMKGRGGGVLPGPGENAVTHEFFTNTEDVRRKGGLREAMEHQENSIKALEASPENPTNWTNGVDAMIRSNTGKAAIIQQYRLYTGHSAGAEDAAAQFKEWIDTGGLSDAQKASLFGAMVDSQNGTIDEWNKDLAVASEYETDPRVAGSPALQAGIARSIHSVFRGGKRQPRTDTSVPGRPDVKLPGTRPQPAAAASAKPAAAHAPGETKVINGVTYVKQGPNHWVPQ